MNKWSAGFLSRVLSLCLILGSLVLVSGLVRAQPAAMSTWVAEVAKLTASDGSAEDRFGWRVAISGGNVVVSAISDDDNGENSGSAYLFERDAGGPDTWGQVAKLIASDGAAGDGFGASISISRDTVVIGAELDDDGGDNSGSAYLFEKPVDGWTGMTETIKLTASDGAAGDYFGWAVSIDGDSLIVGAPKHMGGGAAYLFQRDAGGPGLWGQVAKLTASDGAAISWFGRDVAISGDTVVVGARADAEHGGEGSGSAYLFEKLGAGWADMTETAKLTASNGALGDYFAEYVAIFGDVVVVSASGDDDNGLSAGAAYLFVKPDPGWADMTQTAKLTASDGAASDSLGSAVAISGDSVVAGARQDSEGGPFSGSAYLFEKPGAGWANMTEMAKVTASDGAAHDYFGWSVSISGSTIVVGSSADDDNGTNSGSAYLFYSKPVAWVYLPVVMYNAP